MLWGERPLGEIDVNKEIILNLAKHDDAIAELQSLAAEWSVKDAANAYAASL